MPDTLDLGRCPFCDGDDVRRGLVLGRSRQPIGREVSCDQCGASVQGRDQAEADARWNRRAQSSRISELESALSKAADLFQDAVEQGYPWPREKVEQCGHDKFKWEDCIACYDEFLMSKVEEVRAQARNVLGEKA